MVELREVAHRYPAGLGSSAHPAVQGVSFALHQPAILGVVGSNGSGKSTTLKLLVGLYRPTSGTVRLWGLPSGHREVQPRIGYLSENPRFPESWSGREWLGFHAQLTVVKPDERARRVEETLAWAGIAAVADRRIRTYSRGMLQRLGIAVACVHRPDLLVLDEPTSGLDSTGVTEILSRLRALQREGTTVVVALHQASEIERFCDRVVCLRGGRLIGDGAPADLLDLSRRRSLLVERLETSDLDSLRTWLRQRGAHLLSVESQVSAFPPVTSGDALFVDREDRCA